MLTNTSGYCLLEVLTKPKFPAAPSIFFVRPGQVRPRINILQNFYNGLIIFWGGVWQKLMKILLSTGIICYLISVIYYRRLVESSKQNIIFRILCNFKIFLKISNEFFKKLQFFK